MFLQFLKSHCISCFSVVVCVAFFYSYSWILAVMAIYFCWLYMRDQWQNYCYGYAGRAMRSRLEDVSCFTNDEQQSSVQSVSIDLTTDRMSSSAGTTTARAAAADSTSSRAFGAPPNKDTKA